MRKEDERLRETRLSGEPVFEGRLLHVFRDRVRLPDGGESVRELIRHPGASAIVLLRRGAQGLEVLLERQWRYPLGRAFWEVPAGKLDAGEEPLACARRELREETGCIARDWTPLASICPGIGYSNEVIRLYLAWAESEGDRELDPGEFLNLHWVPFETAIGWAASGEIDDAKTISALFRAEKYLEEARKGDARSPAA